MPAARWAAACLGLLAVPALAAESLCVGNVTADQMTVGVDLSGKVAVITGGDSGLGFATSMALAKRGASVVIANRDEAKGAKAAAQIAAATGADVRALALDLASLASVRAFAENLTQTVGPRVHMLVNNAGMAGNPAKKTADGFDLLFQVDYLGHFLLTELLLPNLRAAEGATVVNVASGAHENACESAGWPEGCFSSWAYLPPPVIPPHNVTVHFRTGVSTASASPYGVAKFLQIQHAAELAVREAGSGIKAYSLTPGFVNTSMTTDFDPESPEIKRICEQQPPPNPCPFQADQGASVIVNCALGRPRSGGYYSRTWGCAEHFVVSHGFTAAMRPRLYDLSRTWAGLDGQPQVVV